MEARSRGSIGQRLYFGEYKSRIQRFQMLSHVTEAMPLVSEPLKNMEEDDQKYPAPSLGGHEHRHCPGKPFVAHALQEMEVHRSFNSCVGHRVEGSPVTRYGQLVKLSPVRDAPLNDVSSDATHALYPVIIAIRL